MLHSFLPAAIQNVLPCSLALKKIKRRRKKKKRRKPRSEKHILLFCQCHWCNDRNRLGGLRRRGQWGGWLDLETKQAREWTQLSNGLARQVKINSGLEESIQRACQKTVKLPSMMDSLDVHSLFAARLRSGE